MCPEKAPKATWPGSSSEQSVVAPVPWKDSASCLNLRNPVRRILFLIPRAGAAEDYDTRRGPLIGHSRGESGLHKSQLGSEEVSWKSGTADGPTGDVEE